MRIVIIGHVCIDRNTSEHASYVAPGSPAMFLTKIFEQLPDCQVAIISPYGEDFLKYIPNDIMYPNSPTTLHTLVYENITKEKKRTQKVFFAEEAAPIPVSQEMQSLLAQADIVYIAPILPNFSAAYIHQITRYIHQNTLKIMLPQGYFRQYDKQHNIQVREFIEAKEILPVMDISVVSEQDHPKMHNVAKMWAKQYHTTIIVTTGEKGAEVYSHEKHFSIPTQPVAEEDVVDSVGSGDIFSAGLGYWSKKTQDIQQSVAYANLLARACLFYTSDAIVIHHDQVIKQLSK